MSDETLDDTILENAKGPAAAATDGTSVHQHSLRDQIAADEHLARKRAARSPLGSLCIVKIIPPGTV